MTNKQKQEPPRSRSTLPTTTEFAQYMSSGWAVQPKQPPDVAAVAPYAAVRRQALSARFPGRRILIPAGDPVTRSNDVHHDYRAHSAFTHLTGWSTGAVPGSILELSPDRAGHVATLYIPPASGAETPAMFADSVRGEFWVGPQPSLPELAALLGVRTRALDALPRVDRTRDAVLGSTSALDTAVSELRLVKDDYETSQLRAAVEATGRGFDDIVRALPQARGQVRGERVIESAFTGRARTEGNGVGYGSVVASGPHACILHWSQNDGPIAMGDLLLVDAGIELDSYYTADITRTLPVNGTFTTIQRRIYQAVLDAADAAIDAAQPGRRFGEIHQTAVAVLADRLEQWGILNVPAAQALRPDHQQHRRYMIHGTSHHLGLDVHDCAKASYEQYTDAVLKAGMVFTVEPGLYFRPDDLTVPPEYRGIGIRIEDNILVTPEGNENLSAAIPRTAHDVEMWIQHFGGRPGADGVHRSGSGPRPTDRQIR